MRAERDIELYLDTMIKEGMYSTKGKLRFHLKTLFKGIDFNNKRVLDIGGGWGLLSFYASCRGAKAVLCLEPEAEGSSKRGTIQAFDKLGKILECDNVEIRSETFQEYEPGDSSFDIIILYNSINHLDETACINLLEDDAHKDTYRKIFSKLHSLLSTGGKLIICDCSRYNFFDALKIRNPVASAIEWHKHQSPKAWARLLGDVGFVNQKIRWSSFNSLGYLGRVLTGNKFMAYFLNSHFRLTMDKP